MKAILLCCIFFFKFCFILVSNLEVLRSNLYGMRNQLPLGLMGQSILECLLCGKAVLSYCRSALPLFLQLLLLFLRSRVNRDRCSDFTLGLGLCCLWAQGEAREGLAAALWLLLLFRLSTQENPERSFQDCFHCAFAFLELCHLKAGFPTSCCCLPCKMGEEP